ncbi:hypothetical protein N9C24_00830 [Gammaproteobacteria bacterium]|nr:hypothetical protein [Gammaproteobacteria bacterium]MDA9932157.1 hypothetical protein [Gammaproteobacteria bacterium]
MHIVGIAWLVANPKSFYEMVEESVRLDEDLVENTVAGSLFISSVLVLFSRIIF